MVDEVGTLHIFTDYFIKYCMLKSATEIKISENKLKTPNEVKIKPGALKEIWVAIADLLKMLVTRFSDFFFLRN